MTSSKFGREINIRSKIMNLKSPYLSDRDSQEQQIQKLHTDYTKSPDYSKPITELLNIRVIQDDGKIVGVYHLPEEVIVKPKDKIVEICDNDDGSLSETYHLVKRKLSWLENSYADSSEILLDLHVK